MLASSNKQAEQDWLGDLLERTKSEADIQSQKFQEYLAQRLLNAANDSNKYSLPKLLSNASVQRMN